MTATATALLALIVLCAFVSEAALGFGATVITVTLGAHLVPLDVILPAFVPLNLCLSAWLVVRGRRAIDRPLLVRRILPLVAVGLVFGLALFRWQSALALQLAFALFVVTIAAVELARFALARGRAADPLPWAAGVALLVAGGFVHGLFASGGPMIVAFAGREVQDKTAFRSTLAALWLILNGALVANYAGVGLFSRATAALSATLAPSLLAGLALGGWAHDKLNERSFRFLVYLLLLFAGATLALRTYGKLA